MFQQRRQATLGNIQLGNLSSPPTFEDMSFLLEQARKYRGRFVEVSWAVPKSGDIFQLTAKVVPNQPLPVWMLYRGQPGNSQLVWGHNSNDLTLMNNLVLLECEKTEADGNQISAQSMNGVVQGNYSAGAIAGGGVSESSNPSSTWLNNLQQAQATDSSVAAAAPPASVASPGVAPQHPATAEHIDLSIDGSLSNINVCSLLRYIVQNRLSGRLAIQSSIGAAEIFFNAGTIKHAATLESKGENALYEAATWGDGEFCFYADQATTQCTLPSDAAALIAGAEQTVEFFKALTSLGLHPAAYVVRTGQLNSAQLEQALRAGLPLDMHLQARFYDAVQDNQTFAEVLRACPMICAEWIPVIYNLIKCGVIAFSDAPGTARPGQFLQGEKLNTAALAQFVTAATAGDGLLHEGVFLYLLQQEFFRHERSGSRFALVLFSLAKVNMLDGQEIALAPETLVEAARRMMHVKRKLDVIGHFDSSTCAILLPETDSAGAAVFMSKMQRALAKPALAPELEAQSLVLSSGIASVPEDARDLETLVAAARVAKNKSKMMGAPVVLYETQ